LNHSFHIAERLRTMSRERKPISSEIILGPWKLLRADAGLVIDAMVTDFERVSGPWHLGMGGHT
jgi:hypothetical protein